MRIPAVANPKGFTLVETILYVGLVSVVLTGMINFLWNVINLGERSQSQQVESSQVQQAIERVGQEVRVAQSVSWDGNVLTLTQPARTVTFVLSGGGLQLSIDGGVGEKLANLESFLVEVNSVSDSQVVSVILDGTSASWQLPLSIPDPVSGSSTPTPIPTPTPVPTTCVEYCQSLSYSSGVCRKNARTCTKSGEVNESGGNYLCTGGSLEDTCCCK